MGSLPTVGCRIPSPDTSPSHVSVSRKRLRLFSSSRAISIRNSSTSTRSPQPAIQTEQRKRWLVGSGRRVLRLRVQVFTPAPRKGNLVARLRGTGSRRPILLLAHLDVVEAKREDWTSDPFTLLEKDGYFYGRGTGDDKYMAAAFVGNLIRYKQEGFMPSRDIILALETDEEVLECKRHGHSVAAEESS